MFTNIDDVMATRHLRHCEILQGSENIIVICSKNPNNAMCKNY